MRQKAPSERNLVIAVVKRNIEIAVDALEGKFLLLIVSNNPFGTLFLPMNKVDLVDQHISNRLQKAIRAPTFFKRVLLVFSIGLTPCLLPVLYLYACEIQRSAGDFVWQTPLRCLSMSLTL